MNGLKKDLNNYDIQKYWDSEDYKTWEKLAHNKAPQSNIGIWLYNNQLQIWEFKNPS